MKTTSILLSASVLLGLSCQPEPQVSTVEPDQQRSNANARVSGNVPSHDPSTIARSGSNYFVFNTGDYLPIGTSTNLVNWGGAGNVFRTIPSWINSAVPGFGTQFWAPDAAYFNGRWNVYYSCSTFGSSTSAIGLVTAPTIPTSGAQWTDRGQVVRSSSNSDVNAIDPSILVDGSSVYMAYGSFFAGIGVYRIDPSTGKPTGGRTIVAGGGGADWEAPCLIKEGSYYYLFVNRGYCCRQANSTYYIVVGRSSSPFGPFVDKNGRSLTSGGGSFVLGTQGRYIGPGQLSRIAGTQNGSVHYYDGNDNGNPKLETVRFTWSGGWPTVAYY
ncbi:arabinan endo-1,5-alpha-L-arabinosidase [Spirosoma soli]|uniref:Arabinan endo-1,5-alpha-L-arabinosidase n=1 Tax=Spirosoma soli TaxID=1770529 RepID=A0ABW5M2R7_9BACT